MKLSFAVALNLALLATAAPAALYSKRADGQEVSPEAELAQKIAYGSLKVAHALFLYLPLPPLARNPTLSYIF
jgi:hypothetical protein